MAKDRKWDKVCQCVSNFMGHLGSEDIVSSILFNERTMLLNDMSNSDPLFRKPLPALTYVSPTVNRPNPDA